VHSIPAHGDVYSIQHYVIKFVSNLRHVSDFLQDTLVPSPIKLTGMITDIKQLQISVMLYFLYLLFFHFITRVKTFFNYQTPICHINQTFWFEFDFDFWCFNATFNNISAISWRPVLMVEEAGVPRENHRPWASNW